MLLFWFAIDIASLTLSNFVLVKSLIEIRFSYFTANNFVDLREAALTRGSNQPLKNAGIERLPVITAVNINSMPAALKTVAKFSFV